MALEDTTIESCNKICQKCKKNFEQDGIDFSPSMCKFCDNGQKLHQALSQSSDSEKKWDSINWNSSKFKTFYKG